MKSVNFPDDLESPNDKFFTHQVVEWFLKNAGTSAEWDWELAGKDKKEQYEALYTKLVELTNVIITKGGKGYFWTIVHPRMFDFISATADKAFATALCEQFPLGYTNILHMGVLDRRWRVYTDTSLDPNNILIGCGFSKKHNNYYCNMKALNFYKP